MSSKFTSKSDSGEPAALTSDLILIIFLFRCMSQVFLYSKKTKNTRTHSSEWVQIWQKIFSKMKHMTYTKLLEN